MDGTDGAVVAQVLAGDRDAFRLLVERHGRALYRFGYRMLGNAHEAEELVQDTFLKAYKNLASFESRSSFATWLHRIAANQALDVLDKRKTRAPYQVSEQPDPEEQEIQVASDAPGPERMLLSRELKTRMAAALEKLTHSERVAFTMRHVEGRSVEEISQVLQIRTNSAKNTIFRAVQKMRRELEPLVGSAG